MNVGLQRDQQMRQISSHQIERRHPPKATVARLPTVPSVNPRTTGDLLDALNLGFVNEAEFDRVVDPAKMVKPCAAAVG